MHKTIGEDQTCTSEDMITDRQAHTHEDRHAHHNTPLPCRGGVIRSRLICSQQVVSQPRSDFEACARVCRTGAMVRCCGDGGRGGRGWFLSRRRRLRLRRRWVAGAARRTPRSDMCPTVRRLPRRTVHVSIAISVHARQPRTMRRQ